MRAHACVFMSACVCVCAYVCDSTSLTCPVMWPIVAPLIIKSVLMVEIRRSQWSSVLILQTSSGGTSCMDSIQIAGTGACITRSELLREV